MSSSRLMEAGRAITPGQPRIPTSVALIMVGLAGMIFLCSALFWASSKAMGWATGDTAKADISDSNAIPDYAPRQVFAVITVEDRVNCLARAYWQITPIQTPTGVVYECHPM